MRSLKILSAWLVVAVFFLIKPLPLKAQDSCTVPSFSAQLIGMSDGNTADIAASGCINMPGTYKVVVFPRGQENNYSNNIYESTNITSTGSFNQQVIVVAPSDSRALTVVLYRLSPDPSPTLSPSSITLLSPNTGDETNPGEINNTEGIDLSKVFLLGGAESKSVAEAYPSPSKIINIIIRNLFIIAGILLFLTILYAGYKFNAQGTKGKDEAKTILTTAITGFIIMFTAYWIIQIIQIITGTKIPL